MKISSIILLTLFITSPKLMALCESLHIFSAESVCNKAVTEDTLKNFVFLRKDTLRLNISPPSKGIQFYRKGIIFTTYSKLNHRVPASFISFGNVNTNYSALYGPEPEKAEPFNGKVTFNCPSDGVTFSKDYDTMYYSIYLTKDGADKIFMATLPKDKNESKGYWILSPEPLEFCSGSFIYTHPALSADGKMMIFSSNRPGGKGGMDLFIIHSTGQGWTRPVTLTDGINSASDEEYPFLDAHNNLWFSSNQSEGFGGYDIYFSRFNGLTWDEPVNAGSYINTGFNDIAFKISRENTGRAIYSVEINSALEKVRLLRVTISESHTMTSLQAKQILRSYKPNPVKETGDTTTAIHRLNPISEKDTVKTEAGQFASKKQQIASDSHIPIYRVQIISSTRPGGDKTIDIKGIDYETYEYLYKGAYRTCIGTFRALSDAVKLQKVCRESGYNQAFVVAFINNERSNDPSLFRK